MPRCKFRKSYTRIHFFSWIHFYSRTGLREENCGVKVLYFNKNRILRRQAPPTGWSCPLSDSDIKRCFSERKFANLPSLPGKINRNEEHGPSPGLEAQDLPVKGGGCSQLQPRMLLLPPGMGRDPQTLAHERGITPKTWAWHSKNPQKTQRPGMVSKSLRVPSFRGRNNFREGVVKQFKGNLFLFSCSYIHSQKFKDKRLHDYTDAYMCI